MAWDGFFIGVGIFWGLFVFGLSIEHAAKILARRDD